MAAGAAAGLRSARCWWTLFQDRELDALEAKVDSANQDLKAGFARLQQARAATRIARADLFPTLDVGLLRDATTHLPHSPTYVPGPNRRSTISIWKPISPTSSTSGDGCATR